MYNQPETILEQYDLEIKQITKGRGAYICDSNQGMKLLMPFRGSKERAAFLCEILRDLKSRGIVVEQVCMTKEGEAVASDETGTRYWLKDLIAGSECSTSREADMMGALGQLAGLHRALAECSLPVPDFMKNERNEPENMYERHYRELIKVKNYVHTRKTKNAFEYRFGEQYPHYIAEAEEALALLNRLDQRSLDKTGKLCHGDFNQHNVVRTAEGFCIVNFENLCCNASVVDLANFIRKMMEKNNWESRLGIRLVQAYDRKRPLSESERQLLYILLLFPEKFWKISNHYSNTHKAWVSQRDIDKLNHMVEIEPARVSFLQNLFSFL